MLFPNRQRPGDPLRAFPFLMREMSASTRQVAIAGSAVPRKAIGGPTGTPPPGADAQVPRQIGHFTDSRSEPLIQAPGPTAVAHNRKEHWQSLLYELWQAAGGNSWDRRIKWSCSNPVPTATV